MPYHKRLLYFILAIYVISVVAVGALLQLTAVSTEVDPEDRFVFENVFRLSNSGDLSKYDDQIALIKRVQKLVLDIAPVGKPIPDYQEREPINLIENGQGLCYDRARTFDKVYKWMGFETRHVYILFKQKNGNEKNFISAFITPGWPSHAVTEVKTSHGWLLVDSNSAWISVNKEGESVRADEVWKRATEFGDIPSYMAKPYWSIGGLYSRKGHLYKPYVQFPEINPPDFFDWLIND